jgi:hypothetical protein
MSEAPRRRKCPDRLDPDADTDPGRRTGQLKGLGMGRWPSRIRPGVGRPEAIGFVDLFLTRNRMNFIFKTLFIVFFDQNLERSCVKEALSAHIFDSAGALRQESTSLPRIQYHAYVKSIEVAHYD